MDEIKIVAEHDFIELDIWSKKWLMSFNPDKTEIMIFNNITLPDNFELSFNGNPINLTNNHKHLGVTLSSDAKWNEHIDNIVKSVSKHLSVLRKLKFSLSRQNLEKLYLTYIRPIFEYASEVWDNCGLVNANKLEKLQAEAARIVTGLPTFTKLEYVYNETGWETLSNRRKVRRIQMFYNIQHNNTPEYL